MFTRSSLLQPQGAYASTTVTKPNLIREPSLMFHNVLYHSGSFCGYAHMYINTDLVRRVVPHFASCILPVKVPLQQSCYWAFPDSGLTLLTLDPSDLHSTLVLTQTSPLALVPLTLYQRSDIRQSHHKCTSLKPGTTKTSSP